MSFLLIKTSHIALVVASYTLFVLRGIWSLRASPVMQTRWVRVVPHLVDTLLLVSALTLAHTIRQYPFIDTWLTAKVVGLAIYVILGFIALRRGINKSIRLSSWLAAQAAFGYIVLVAINHNPLPL